MKANEFVKERGLDHVKAVLSTMPKFARESISQDEVMYNPRTKKYIERGPCSVLIQLDGEDDYYHSTMPYESSFYEECVLINDLKRLVESIDIIKDLDGIKGAKATLYNLVQLDWGEFEHRYIDNWVCTKARLEQAITDVEACQ